MQVTDTNTDDERVTLLARAASTAVTVTSPHESGVATGSMRQTMQIEVDEASVAEAVRLQMRELERSERAEQERREQEDHDAFIAAQLRRQLQQQQQQQLSRQELLRRSSAEPIRFGRLQESPSSRAARLRADMLWFCAIDLIFCFLLIAPLGMLALAGCASPLIGIASATTYEWRIGGLTVVCSVAAVALRAAYIPYMSSNFLWAVGSAALSLSSLHVASLSASWTALLWRHGAEIKPHRRNPPNRRTRERAAPRVERVASPIQSPSSLQSQRAAMRSCGGSRHGVELTELSEGVPITVSHAIDEDGVADGPPLATDPVQGHFV